VHSYYAQAPQPESLCSTLEISSTLKRFKKAVQQGNNSTAKNTYILNLIPTENTQKAGL
jgi:hypothetical protein